MKSQPKVKILSSEISNTNNELKEQLRDLVIARLSAIPKNLQIAVGASQYTIEELVKSVERGDEVGNKLVAMQVQYLKDLASGEMYKGLDD
jgi:hypothetical protein